MTKPDRWHRAVQKAAKVHVANGFWIWSTPTYQAQVVKLLKREHRAVVRKVKALGEYVAKKDRGRGYEFQDGYVTACSDLLAWLTPTTDRGSR